MRSTRPDQRGVRLGLVLTCVFESGGTKTLCREGRAHHVHEHFLAGSVSGSSRAPQYLDAQDLPGGNALQGFFEFLVLGHRASSVYEDIAHGSRQATPLLALFQRESGRLAHHVERVPGRKRGIPIRRVLQAVGPRFGLGAGAQSGASGDPGA